MFNGVTARTVAAREDISVTQSRRGSGPAAATVVWIEFNVTQRLHGVVSLTLEMENEGGVRTPLTNTPFEITATDAGEMILNSEQQATPWSFLIKVNKATKQMSLRYTLKYPGLSIERALEGIRFNQALARGGDLRILGAHPVTGGTVQLVRGGLPSGTYPGPDARFIKMLEQLAFIQDKIGVFFTVPDRNVNPEDVRTVAATAQILETGRGQYKAEPWTSVSNVEQAKAALEMFEEGKPQPMALHFEDQVVVILGTHVPLGPVTFFCDQAYITKDDLETLRRELEASPPESSINIRFTPYEGGSVEARYINWLPEEEAAAIRQLPMYQEGAPGHGQEEWVLPPMDADEAVALLQSWYDEDAGEQREAWEHLRAALDEDRLSDRKLFS
jgi:hypothetical protein